jgi:hypothetical protein
MKRRKKKPDDLMHRFQTTCGWRGRRIAPNTPVFGSGGKARPGIDLSAYEGQVIPLPFLGQDKTVFVAVPALDSEARRQGHDSAFMACNESRGRSLRAAFEAEIVLENELGLV